MYTQYGYPAYPFPGIPVMQHVQADNYGGTDVPIGNYPDPLNYSNSSNMVPEMQAKALAMTPQEKIEKLRRRQQAQAMLAIQQQQQQFGHQIMGAEDTVSQENFQRNKGQGVVKSDSSMEENENKLPPLGLNILHEHDSSQRINALTDDNSSEKTIYYQLQDSLRKLDIRVRLCIRDSLLRLARSSMERQNASDRNSTNKSTKEEHEVPVHEDMNTGERHTGLPDAETYTNPIDRTVAQLLFHRPLDSGTRPMNDEVPQSPMLHNPK
ncbi:uncharacterized protein A4U43_C02F18550 [Asparagus officinalis]|uniref:Uncharacterized protein n=1 Tax=Asparagus officinalis TaxID=4686 RepID=A0A5P1FLY1_ASPOF|nr:uncharacterized protein A4U43_C02F18550 [Asparagus officinalis]